MSSLSLTSSDWPRRTDESPRRALNWLPARSGVVELALFFAIVCGAQYFVTGSFGSFEVSPHPFWIPVILLSVQYGTVEGIIAALAALAITLLSGVPERALTEDFNVHLLRVAAEPAMWLLAATLLGSFRDRQKDQIASLTLQWAKAVEQRDSISDHCKKLRARNQSLQRQIARGRFWSIPRAYLTIQQLRSQPFSQNSDLLAKCMDMLVGAEKFSVFQVNGNNALERASSWGWDMENAWHMQYSQHDRLYQAVVCKARSLASVREEDAAVLQDQGTFAVPLVSPATSAVIGMLKVEEISEHEITSETERDLQFLAEQLAHSFEQSRIKAPGSISARLAKAEQQEALAHRGSDQESMTFAHQDSKPADHSPPAHEKQEASRSIRN